MNDNYHLISKNFGLTLDKEGGVSEDEILAALTRQIEYMLEYEREMLLSLLYRLDISEKDILIAIMPGNPESAAICLAKKIMERQKQKQFTQKNIFSKGRESGDKDYDDLMFDKQGWNKASDIE